MTKLSFEELAKLSPFERIPHLFDPVMLIFIGMIVGVGVGVLL